MKMIQKELPFTGMSPLTEEIFTETAIFFDIETTGFSPTHTSLYLIGTARRKGTAVKNGGVICIDQFFAEKPGEEKLILTAFLELLRGYDTIITYNGIGFDIPYLKAKCAHLMLSEQFADFTYVDIFKSVSKLKHIFKLDNYKQKSIEQFLGIARSDLYSGGELIQIYKNYVKDPDNEILDLLLLHNYEDVLGMMELIPILSYVHLFGGNFEELEDVELCDCKNYDGKNFTTGKELVLKLVPTYPLPQRITYRFHDLYLSGKGSSISLVIRVTQEPLKYFYPNYKEYYYLPEEDTAIHKSVAAYVDKEHRKQATASTCYTKKEGQFLPQYYSPLFTPAFLRNYGDKVSYFELTENFYKSPDECNDMLFAYIKHLLAQLQTANHKI